MAVSFKVPSSPAKSILTIDTFQGADFTNSPANVDDSKSPNTVNMIRDVPGKVRKSMGWEVTQQFGGKPQTYEQNTTVIVEDSVLDRVLTDVTMTSRIFTDEELFVATPQDIKVSMADYIGDKTKAYVIPSENFSVSNGNWSSDGFWGAMLDSTECKDELDFANGKIKKRVFFLSEYTKAKFTSLLNSLVGLKVGVVGKTKNNKRFIGWISFSDSKYSWNITNTQGTMWEVNGDNDLTRFPITEGFDLYFYSTHVEEIDIELPTLEEFKTYTRRSTISCEHAIGFTATVVDPNNLQNINGFHRMRNDEYGLVHVGTNIYRNGELLYSEANDSLSKGWQFEDKYYIIDGKKMLVYYTKKKANGEIEHIVDTAENNAYLPLVTISKEPEGGGTPYDDLNLLNPGFQESFLGKTGVTQYHLSFNGLDNRQPIVEVMKSNGDFVTKRYGIDYTINYSTGVVTFTTAPGVSPLTGEDNVRITAYRTVEGYADRINKCTIGVLYGVNGALDRLFLSGNPDYINYDWFSGQYDPTYFTDTSYSMMGSSSSAIMGYSVINGFLATHKDFMERDQNIILREGDLQDNIPVFRIVNTLQGAGAIAKNSFAYLSTEPLFLTKSGVYAVTAQDITGEKYAQNRSFFINGKLLEEQNLEDAYGFVFKDMYWLCLNDIAYILDGLQPIQTDKSMPYATRQYVGFYRTNMPARCIWEQDNILYFGTRDGRVCRYHTDKYALQSYNDNGDPIEAVWETPDIDGKLFYKNKTLRYIALRLDSALATSVNIYVMNRGLWQFLKKDDTSGRYISFMHLVFSKFSFSGDKTQHTFSTKVRVKKVDKFRLKLTNDDLNEPFGLFNIAFEYVENGNYKG